MKIFLPQGVDKGAKITPIYSRRGKKNIRESAWLGITDPPERLRLARGHSLPGFFGIFRHTSPAPSRL